MKYPGSTPKKLKAKIRPVDMASMGDSRACLGHP